MLVIVSKVRDQALMAYHDGLRLVGPNMDYCAGVLHELDYKCIVCSNFADL